MAYAQFLAAQAEEKKRPRSKGDFLALPRSARLCHPQRPMHPTFKALFQGDAGGVEFATAGHEGFCREEAGCRANTWLSRPWDGLIIDDYFSLGLEPCSFAEGSPSQSAIRVAAALQEGRRHRVRGKGHLEL